MIRNSHSIILAWKSFFPNQTNSSTKYVNINHIYIYIFNSHGYNQIQTIFNIQTTKNSYKNSWIQPESNISINEKNIIPAIKNTLEEYVIVELSNQLHSIYS